MEVFYFKVKFKQPSGAEIIFCTGCAKGQVWAGLKAEYFFLLM